MWALGCVIAEIATGGEPLFAPHDESYQDISSSCDNASVHGWAACQDGDCDRVGGGRERTDEDQTGCNEPRLTAVQRQLLELIDALGSPLYDELLLMNPALHSRGRHSARVRDWMTSCLPSAPTRPWQPRILAALAKTLPDALAEMGGRDEAERCLLQPLEAIFQYAPRARPRAQELARMPFFSCHAS